MTSEQYQAYLTESIKIAAKMMYDMAEDIAGKSDFISDLTVTIDFDPKKVKYESLDEKTMNHELECLINRGEINSDR